MCDARRALSHVNVHQVPAADEEQVGGKSTWELHEGTHYMLTENGGTGWSSWQGLDFSVGPLSIVTVRKLYLIHLVPFM